MDEDVYFEKWFLVKDENKNKKSTNIINVDTEMGKAQLCRLIRIRVEEEEEEGRRKRAKKFLNFIIRSQYEDISVRDILLMGENKNNNPEDEDYVKLLRTFIITYESMDLF